MPHFLRRCAAALLVTAIAATATAAPPARKAPPTPKLIVAISVDQFADALYQRYRPTFTGGLARLGRGVTFTGYQSHAATETCPGHSTILTGRHPAATGIVTNNWLDKATGQRMYCVAVPGAPDDARGPQNLRVPTLGDWLKNATPAAKVVSISGKDRAAIMMGGHKADAIYWWRDGAGFDSSSYATLASPVAAAAVTAFDNALLDRWRAAAPDLWPAQISPRCAALAKPHRFGQADLPGTLPPPSVHAAEAEKDYWKRAGFSNEFHASPLLDTVTEQMAEQLIDDQKLGRNDATDLLAISFSATDYVGHHFGNGGGEMCVQMAALDATLGKLFAKLDSLHVPYVVALTADHGAIDAPERIAGHSASDRVDPRAFVGALNADLRSRLGLAKDPIVAADGDPQALTIVAADDSQKARISDAALAWLRARPDVVAATPVAAIAAMALPVGHPDKLTLLQRYRESFDAERGSDIYVEFGEYASRSMPKNATDQVAGHGSPWDHDRQVPMLFWWPGATPQPRKEAVETVDIAPTLSAIAGISAPVVDGACLPQVAGNRCH